MDKAHVHAPVLLDEVVTALNVLPAGVYVDCTFGRGGHTRAILQRLGERGRVLALDRDPDAVEYAAAIDDPRLTVVRAPFSELEQQVRIQGYVDGVDGVLFDLGVSSPQLEQAARGFSFLRDGPLDMRMDPHTGQSAADWLARAGEREIADCLHDYGEERHARRIARAIVASRTTTPITTTGQLAAVIARAHPAWEPGQHPATRSFQAIRIFINNELEELKRALSQALNVLKVGGRMAVISFHSLEDRIVKQFIRREAQGPELPPDLPIRAVDVIVRLRRIGKAIRPGRDEISRNPRARSAVLRVAEKIV
jgi:16S rRNA (cytosine1402-N4)-methyltransferase